MGFPDNYTKLCYLSDLERHSLIGNSLSIPVFTHLISPLTNYHESIFHLKKR
jgi:hypothetical protein